MRYTIAANLSDGRTRVCKKIFHRFSINEMNKQLIRQKLQSPRVQVKSNFEAVRLRLWYPLTHTVKLKLKMINSSKNYKFPSRGYVGGGGGVELE